MKYLILFACFNIAVLFMAFGLYISGYRRRTNGHREAMTTHTREGQVQKEACHACSRTEPCGETGVTDSMGQRDVKGT